MIAVQQRPVVVSSTTIWRGLPRYVCNDLKARRPSSERDGRIAVCCSHSASPKRGVVSASQCAQEDEVSRTVSIVRDLLYRMYGGMMSGILWMWWILPYTLRAWLRSVWCGEQPVWPPTYNRRHVLMPLSVFMTTETSKSKRHRAKSLGIDKSGRSHKAAQKYFQSWMIEELLGMGVQNKQLYLNALMHPSALEPEQRYLSYERLEYLGDAVMELAVREMLMDRIPMADEGILTFQTQALVRGDAVSMISAWIGLDKFIITNAYSLRKSLLKSPSILCDAFEALLGAIYVDKGLDAVKLFLTRVYTECPMIQWDQFDLERNFVTELQKRASDLDVPSVPQYITVCNNDVPYTVQVCLNGSPRGVGSSHDLRLAKQIAARAALESMQRA